MMLRYVIDLRAPSSQRRLPNIRRIGTLSGTLLTLQKNLIYYNVRLILACAERPILSLRATVPPHYHQTALPPHGRSGCDLAAVRRNVCFHKVAAIAVLHRRQAGVRPQRQSPLPVRLSLAINSV